MSGMTRSRVKYDKTCLHCNKNFTVPEYRKDIARYCSRKCTAFATRVQTTSACQTCGNEFTHIASRASKAKYCGTKCYYKAMNNKGSVEYTCLHCSKKFMDSPSHKRKYCSVACTNKTTKANWNPAFSTVRKAMLARDLLNKCERCGYDAEPKILGVHHKDRDRKNNALSNLEVLCPNCHSLEHMKHVNHGFTE